MRLVSVMTVILSGASLGLGLISTVLEIQGRNLTVTGYANDKLLHHMITTGDWEPHLYGLAKRLLPLGTETALDIGANLGYLTLHLSEILSKGGHVYAFEPIPSTYSVLEKNVQQNNYTQQTKTFHNAVSDDGLTICVQGFREDPQRKRNMGDVKLPEHHHDQTCTGEAVAVKCVAVDEMVKQQMMKSVDFIKIDVQGFEYKVLLSAVDTLKKHQPYVVVEFEEANLKRMRSRVGTVELVKHVRESMQYEVFFVSYEYPSDHLLVPQSKLAAFRTQFKDHIFPLNVSNTVNPNLEAGVREQVCLDKRFCPDVWKHHVD